MQQRALLLSTDAFNSVESKPHFINERCFGEDFAAWVAERLPKYDIEVSEPIQEDWGWCVIATKNGRKFTVFIGIMDDSIGQSPAEWRIGASYERPMNGPLALFRPVPRAELESVAKALHDICHAQPDFRDVRWAED